MTVENIERNRRLVEAYNARDLDTMLGYLDPEIEFHSTFAAVEGAPYHGHDGIRRWHKDLTDAWGKDVRIELETLFDVGEQTLVFYVLHGRGAGSGARVAMPAGYVVRWRMDLAVYLRNYTDRAEALRDLGVPEERLQPIAP